MDALLNSGSTSGAHRKKIRHPPTVRMTSGCRSHCKTITKEHSLTPWVTWVSIDDDGSAAEFTSYGRNDADAILAAVAKAFETEIFSEEEPQFWGFETNEELYEHIREVSLARRKAQPLQDELAIEASPSH